MWPQNCSSLNYSSSQEREGSEVAARVRARVIQATKGIGCEEDRFTAGQILHTNLRC